MSELNRTVLITGASGQLGQCLKVVAPANIKLISLPREEFDISNINQISECFKKHKFDVLVNCAAFTAVDLAESKSEDAFHINSEAVQNLAIACHRHDKTLIHISSDYVYDNGMVRPLIESDPTEPKSVYALSKLQGDHYALQENKKTFVLRTSWLYSEYGHNFVKTMLRLGRNHKQLRVVSDQHGIPTYARDLAKAVVQIVLSDLKGDEYGIYHVANTGATTWSVFANAIFEKSNMRVEMTPIETIDYPTQAARPKYSVLDSNKFSNQFDLEMRDWRDALDECLIRIADDSNTDN